MSFWTLFEIFWCVFFIVLGVVLGVVIGCCVIVASSDWEA